MWNYVSLLLPIKESLVSTFGRLHLLPTSKLFYYFGYLMLCLDKPPLLQCPGKKRDTEACSNLEQFITWSSQETASK